LFLDAFSGLAGDMIIAALVDLGVPREVVLDAVHATGFGGFHVHWEKKVRSGIVATRFDVHVDGAQPERTFKEIRTALEGSKLADPIKARALRAFGKLAESEAKVHRMSIDDVHFHEVGAVDAIVDIVGSAAALEHVGAEVIVSPLPMGRGFVKARHGTLPLPAPATIECLSGFETYDANIAFELVTPTGAAIVAANATRSERWPRMLPRQVGWGAGTADLPDRPNLLRAVLGEPIAGAREGTHVVLECNLDDATGELVAGAIETLLSHGALDAWASPITMKKGRPAVVLSVLATAEAADRTAELVLRETTSLGVRRYPVDRIERPRRTEVAHTPFGPIPIKIAEGPYGPPQIKPEWDACVAAAHAHDVPVREVIRAALVAQSKAEGAKKPG
jgi:uncharacterized protein (TIGR00299 family) protein